MSPQNDPPQNNDEPRAFDFDAQTAANVAVMKWIDSSGGLRRLVGCTPSMIVGVALHAYRESLAAKPPPPPHRMEAWVTAPSESWAALQASILDVADAATRELLRRSAGMTATPAKYRKKPVEIEAVQFRRDLTPAEAHAIYRWIESNTLGSFEPLDVIEGRMPYPASGVSIDPRDGRMIISTLEGLHWVDLDDWVIRGIKGEFYPCKPDIFEATYEAVELGITKGAEAADGAQ